MHKLKKDKTLVKNEYRIYIYKGRERERERERRRRYQTVNHILKKYNKLAKIEFKNGHDW